MIDAPWFVRNADIYKNSEIKQNDQTCSTRLQQHTNTKMQQLVEETN